MNKVVRNYLPDQKNFSIPIFGVDQGTLLKAQSR